MQHAQIDLLIGLMAVGFAYVVPDGIGETFAECAVQVTRDEVATEVPGR